MITMTCGLRGGDEAGAEAGAGVRFRAAGGRGVLALTVVGVRAGVEVDGGGGVDVVVGGGAAVVGTVVVVVG
jgi:hypothetical protein